MVKIEIRIQGAVRDNIVCKWVTEEQLSFLRTLEDDNWAFKGERPNLKITIIDNLYDRRKEDRRGCTKLSRKKQSCC